MKTKKKSKRTAQPNKKTKKFVVGQLLEMIQTEVNSRIEAGYEHDDPVMEIVAAAVALKELMHEDGL